MDKIIMLAVAGAGKTSFIIDDLNPEKFNVIIGYTHANIQNIKEKIISKFSIIPKKTKVLPFFQFLYTYCYRPVLANSLKTKGLIFTKPESNKFNKAERQYYITPKGYIYHNRLAHLIQYCKRNEKVLNRINLFVEKLYIDEIQDFASYDFDFILGLVKLNIPVLGVGDFHQHTFDSSRDRSKRSGLHVNYKKYQSEFLKVGWIIDKTTLVNSYRCTPSICNFIRKNLKIEIFSNKNEVSIIKNIDNLDEVKAIYEDNNIIKLFFRNHLQMNCYSNNWGLSKGENKYKDVCIIMTDKIKICFQNKDFSKLAPTTLKKFYVACSRANRDLYFIDRKLLKKIISA